MADKQLPDFQGASRPEKSVFPTILASTTGAVREYSFVTVPVLETRVPAYMDKDNLQRLPLSSLAHRCAEESDLFFRRQPYDPRYCYEIFRRAILEGDQAAWARLFKQYHPLVTGWVKRHPAFAESGEESDYFSNRALEKLWSAIGPERFDRFPDLKSVLRYLQLCVHSVILDHVRHEERAVFEDLKEPEASSQPQPRSAIEDRTLQRIERQEFWEWVAQRLKNEKERAVMHGTYVLGMKARQIFKENSRLFNDVKEVYRVKENVLSRFRRDPERIGLLARDA